MDGAGGDEFVDLRGGGVGDALFFRVEDAGDVGHEDEVVGGKARGDVGGAEVGVDVEGVAVFVEGERGDDGQVAVVEQGVDDFRLHVADLPDAPEFRRMLGSEHGAILAADAAGAQAALVQGADDGFVDVGAERHFHDIERGLVGVALSGDEVARRAGFFQPVIDLRAAAMNDDGAVAQFAGAADGLGKGAQGVVAVDGVAAVFDDEGLHHCFPVWPKPPSPRSLSSNSLTMSSVGRRTGRMTSWAMRSPSSMV